MACRPFRAGRVQAYEAYIRRMMVSGMIFKEQQRERVPCPECGKDLAKGSLVNHRQNQHGGTKWGLGSEGGSTDKVKGVDDPITYRMAFPEWVEPRPCPVEGCSGQASTWRAMKVHFWHR